MPIYALLIARCAHVTCRIPHHSVRNMLIAAGTATAAWYAFFYGRRWIQRERRKALLANVRDDATCSRTL